MGKPQNRWFIKENLKWMILGYPYFRNPPHTLHAFLMQNTGEKKNLWNHDKITMKHDTRMNHCTLAGAQCTQKRRWNTAQMENKKWKDEGTQTKDIKTLNPKDEPKWQSWIPSHLLVVACRFHPPNSLPTKEQTAAYPTKPWWVWQEVPEHASKKNEVHETKCPHVH